MLELIKSMRLVGWELLQKTLISIKRTQVLTVLIWPSSAGVMSMSNNLQGMVTQGDRQT
ncbi:hypothetical protein [Spiribacter sp. SSL99]|uniref:hypothetical protein n=1 Tax=Spiribacter sp. SSL99 TaxID=1866884 RepID=UPI00132FE99F|nr:hypothetical protein [Spiribacter sp. SSL99]